MSSKYPPMLCSGCRHVHALVGSHIQRLPLHALTQCVCMSRGTNIEVWMLTDTRHYTLQNTKCEVCGHHWVSFPYPTVSI